MHLSTIHIRVSRNKASPTPMPSQNMQMTILCLNFSVYISPHFWEEGSQSYHNAKDCNLLAAIPISETTSRGQKPDFIQTVHAALSRSTESSDSTFKKKPSTEPCKISLLKELKSIKPTGMMSIPAGCDWLCLGICAGLTPVSAGHILVFDTARRRRRRRRVKLGLNHKTITLGNTWKSSAFLPHLP